jgi:hypothetical protein
MGDVISFDLMAGIIRDDVPPHIDDYGHVMLLGAFVDLVKLRDSAADDYSRSQVDAVVKLLSVVLARYEPDGAA